MDKSESKAAQTLKELSAIKWNVAFKGIIGGLFSGFLVVLYRLGIEFGTEKALDIYSFLRLRPAMIIPWLLLAASAGTLIAWLIRLEPMACGSGIPQVEGLLIFGMKIKALPVLVVRFFAGLLSSFFGVSLGREGPSIQIGAAASQIVAKKLGKTKLEENFLITGGAAAGLSAAFNAPLSGIVFALEEVHRSFSGLILIAATTASLTADVVSKCFFGLKPVLHFLPTPQLPIKLYIWIIPLGILSGLSGVLISKALLGFQTLYKKLPWFLRPCAALFIALPCGLLLPQVLGGGTNLIFMAETGDAGIKIILIILCVKFLFTCTSFGSGIPGGIFMPILSIGALTGSLLGLVAIRLGMPAEYLPDFAVCGMAGALASSVKAPVTSILLTAEMTGTLMHLLPVAACTFTAMFISDLLNVPPIYEALLDRITESGGDEIKSCKQGGIVEIPVELGSTVSGKRVSEVDWPDGTLIVNIRRGSAEIVPNGKTVISPGDYLTVISTENTYGDISSGMRELCHHNA